MDSDIVIKVENLGKKYTIGEKQPYLSFRDTLTNLIKTPINIISPKKKEEFWALKDVSFEVKKGEVIGVIGKNGAGKSTLLKILSRITEPTTGKVQLRGRIASMLEVGTGFHPELTGRENIYLNGSILGMTRKEINNKFNKIVDFSGIDEFIDTPVKKYSSGMYVRLAFAVAAHLESEILLVDEVLAVGDAEFQKRCLGKMKDISESNRTIIFVSHNMRAVQNLCPRSILLSDGKLERSGNTADVIHDYLDEYAGIYSLDNPVRRNSNIKYNHSGPTITSVEITDLDNKIKSEFTSLEEFRVTLKLQNNKYSYKEPFSAIWFLFDDMDNQIAVGASSPMDNIKFTDQQSISFTFNPEPLIPGKYSFRFVLQIPNLINFDSWEHAINFEITKNDYFGNGYLYPGIWNADLFIKHKWE